MDKRKKRRLPRNPFRDNEVRVFRLGMPRFRWNDLYHLLLTQPWPQFLLLVSAFYLGLNLLFAIAYVLTGNGISNVGRWDLLGAFFFSIQTFATIGYGVLAPVSLVANVLVVLESLVGLLAAAMTTGLVFARFARPTARVIFSKLASISEIEGQRAFVFRVANERHSHLLEASLSVVLLRNEIDADGQLQRNQYDLPLLRQRTGFFSLSWTAVHLITPASPLYGLTEEDLDRCQAEVVVTLSGTDEYFAQAVWAVHTYYASNILWDVKFVSIMQRQEDGSYVVDFSNFHKVRPLR